MRLMEFPVTSQSYCWKIFGDLNADNYAQLDDIYYALSYVIPSEESIVDVLERLYN